MALSSAVLSDPMGVKRATQKSTFDCDFAEQFDI